MPQQGVAELAQEFRISGFCVLRQIIAPETVASIRRSWEPIRDRDIERQGEVPGRGRHRYNVRVPMMAPFVDAEIFEHPKLVALLSQILGEDYVWTHFDSNVPLVGSSFQSWHRDGSPSLPSPAFDQIMLPCSCVGVKFPLVDTSPSNGSFEVVPATQHVLDAVLPKADSAAMDGALSREGSSIFSTRLNLRAGDLWIQDGRCFHRVSATAVLVRPDTHEL
eukprot:COSAG06_NODE_4251_length_4429_cov_50.160970_4_plen_221_part_00